MHVFMIIGFLTKNKNSALISSVFSFSVIERSYFAQKAVVFSSISYQWSLSLKIESESCSIAV